MSVSLILLLLSLLAPIVARPLPSATNDTTPDGVIVAPLTIKYSDQHPLPHRNPRPPNKRSVHQTPITLSNDNSHYDISLTIGTPPQNFQCLLDTGASDFWVSSSENPICGTVAHDCRFGAFVRSRSSTWQLNSSTAQDNSFAISYGDGSIAQGFWGNDVVTLAGSVSLQKCSVALATHSTSTMGVLGLGLPELAVTNQRAHSPYTYPNVPALMVQQGLISRNAYSLYLGDTNNKNAKVIFGGIDTCAYSGTLVPLPLVSTDPNVQTPNRLAVDLTSFDIFSGVSSQRPVYSRSITLPVVLDSGASLTYLPVDIVKSVNSALKATFEPAIQVYVTTCSQTGSFQFGFNRASIKVPFSEILTPLEYNDGRPVNNQHGQRMCAVGIQEYPDHNEPHFILGANFLRSAYALFDLHNKQISLAQAVRSPNCVRIETLRDAGTPARSHKRGSVSSSANFGFGDDKSAIPSASPGSDIQFV